ncbi:MAG: ATP synthase F1 subunit gamma [Saprospirales bacterium]|nr:ATP synthase F1 subunit gamma [Saprospirales bacterium]
MSGRLKEVRERIKSVENTQQITKAMKMVSAAKLRKAQQAIQDMRPYANKLNDMLRNILSNLDGDVDISFGNERELHSACMVVVTSNRGLCGAFNTNVIKDAVKTIDEKYAAVRKNNQLTILCIGKKGFDFFRKRYPDCKFINDHVSLFEDLTFPRIAEVSQRLMDAFEHNEFDSISVSYGQFRNAGVQYPVTEQFLPVPSLEKGEGNGHRANYIFEPDMKDLLRNLIPSILHTSFQKYVLDTHASEHGARMTAMDNATSNADEIMRDLRISYNKARQEAITRELSEIVGGAAALENV